MWKFNQSLDNKFKLTSLKSLIFDYDIIKINHCRPKMEPNMNKNLIYTSESTFKSLWQEYRIYEDHLDFVTLFGHIIIPFDQIEHIEVQESDVKGLLKGDLKLKGFRPAIKLDWANFQEHVVLDKTEGFCKRLLFTPQSPQQFKDVLEDALKNYHRIHHNFS